MIYRISEIAWGFGKTSFLNFTQRILEKAIHLQQLTAFDGVTKGGPEDYEIVPSMVKSLRII